MANPTLSEEQIKTLENAFASYPENWKVLERFPLYASMEGVKEQIRGCEYRTALIFYATAEREEDDKIQLKINKMEVTDPTEMSIEEAEATLERMMPRPSTLDYLIQSELCDTIQIVKKSEA